METVLVKALSFILIILCAYALKRAGIFCKEDNRIVMKLILNVTLPAAVVAGFSGYTRDLSLVLAAFLGFGLNVVMMLSGYLAAYRKSREEHPALRRGYGEGGGDLVPVHSDGDYRDHIAGDPVEFIAIREAVYGACSAHM